MENELRIQPQDFEDRIMLMSMYNDIDWTAKNNASTYDKNSSQSLWVRQEVSRGTLDFPRSWRRRKIVRDARLQNQWRMKSNSRVNDAEFRGERAQHHWSDSQQERATE